jgi:hypothetical protein
VSSDIVSCRINRLLTVAANILKLLMAFNVLSMQLIERCNNFWTLGAGQVVSVAALHAVMIALFIYIDGAV